MRFLKYEKMRISAETQRIISTSKKSAAKLMIKSGIQLVVLALLMALG
jgi:hypothetical protein